jgi:hypothetical protein
VALVRTEVSEELRASFISVTSVGEIGTTLALRRVAIVKTDVSEELCASFIRVTRISVLGTTLAVTSNQRRASVAESSLRYVLF